VRRRLAIALLATLLAGPAVACAGGARERIEVRIGRLVVTAELARTPEERTQGLSGRSALPDDAGMLFVFPNEQQPTFWMKDMRFPLDVVWISGDKHVVAVTEQIPPPAPGTPDGALPLYSPTAPVLYTLEVNGGLVKQLGIHAGDPVAFTPEVPTANAR
jgi:uncharacterized membrane protein (UPF0127 family)